ncbi:MAG: HD domain-containing phosphohydrolase [Candidatus Zixiibacteriota bacterium]
MDSVSTRDLVNGGYLPVYRDALRPGTAPEFDLYIECASGIVLYNSACTPFSGESHQALLDGGITRLYVAGRDRRAYHTYLEKHLSEIATDQSLTESVRAGIVYDCAKLLMEDLFARPTMGENIRRSQELVASTVGFVLTGRAAFESLLRVMSFDYSTYTHSVNVCALSIALAQYVGIRNPKDLKVLGTGTLLHDIGKTRIDDAILNKKGQLSEAEFEQVRQHPCWGHEILSSTDMIEKDSYLPVIQHHERENGTGYPLAIDGSGIHIYGKITAIADVFDAMTTQRSYRSAIDAYPALRSMFADQGAFDRNLLEQFARMLVPKKP